MPTGRQKLATRCHHARSTRVCISRSTLAAYQSLAAVPTIDPLQAVTSVKSQQPTAHPMCMRFIRSCICLDSGDQGVAGGHRTSPGTTEHDMAASAGKIAKTILNAVKEVADVFPPLKSAAAGIQFVVECAEASYALLVSVIMIFMTPLESYDQRRRLEGLGAACDGSSKIGPGSGA